MFTLIHRCRKGMTNDELLEMYIDTLQESIEVYRDNLKELRLAQSVNDLYGEGMAKSLIIRYRVFIKAIIIEIRKIQKGNNA